MVQKLTGGTLLLRNKYYIVIYRGKDFIPTSVAAILSERQEENVRCKAVDVSGEDETYAQAGSMAEFNEAQALCGREISTEECEKMMKEAAEAKNVRLMKEIERKPAVVSIYFFFFFLKKKYLLFL